MCCFQDNPSDKDVNQGTLVVFNLDASVSNDDLRQIFGEYGEVKEVSACSLNVGVMCASTLCNVKLGGVASSCFELSHC